MGPRGLFQLLQEPGLGSAHARYGPRLHLRQQLEVRRPWERPLENGFQFRLRLPQAFPSDSKSVLCHLYLHLDTSLAAALGQQ